MLHEAGICVLACLAMKTGKLPRPSPESVKVCLDTEGQRSLVSQETA